MKPCLLALVLAAFLAGCKNEISPLVAGEVQISSTGEKYSLSQQQLKSLEGWFERSLSGWGRCLYTPPGSSISISLSHADGSHSSVSLLKFPASSKQTTLRASHLNGSNLSEQPCALQSFDVQEIDLLLSIVGVPQ